MLNGLIMRAAIAISGLWFAVVLIMTITVAARDYFPTPDDEGGPVSEIDRISRPVELGRDPTSVWELVSAIVLGGLGPAVLLVGAAGLICWILGPLGRWGGERNRHSQEGPDE